MLSLKMLSIGLCDQIDKVPDTGAGATFDWLFFDNSKLIDFDC